jgi:hypothetical protein
MVSTRRIDLSFSVHLRHIPEFKCGEGRRAGGKFASRPQAMISRRMKALPRSGCVSKPRVASTLGELRSFPNPERFALHERNRVAVEQLFNPVTQDSRSGNPGLSDATALR